eukprot:423818_1
MVENGARDGPNDDTDIDWNRVWLFQDVELRKSEPRDITELITQVIVPSYNHSLLEFKYMMPRTLRSIQSDVITSIFNKLTPFYVRSNSNYKAYTFCNNKLNMLVGFILTSSNGNTSSFIRYLWLLSTSIAFTMPFTIGVSSCWKLIQIYFAQKVIHSEFQKRFKAYEYQSIEMVSTIPKYQNNGYGSYMIQKIHQQIYGEDSDQSLPIMIAFTATPRSVHFYEQNGYKLFVKVYIGVELTYCGFIYHQNAQYLEKIMTAFPTNNHIDLCIFHHVLPASVAQWILLMICIPFIIVWSIAFIVLHMFR